MTHLLPQPSSLEAQASRAAVLAGLLLVVLVVMTMSLGVSQQEFEVLMEPARYARLLVEHSAALRAIVIVDDLFIPTYIVAGLLVSLALDVRRHPLLIGMMVTTVVAGLLDFVENHHILSIMRGAELGILPSVEELRQQEVASSLKWWLGHTGFALLGLSLAGSGWLIRAARYSLLFVQLPIGVLTLCVFEPEAGALLAWLRYGSTVFGFLLAPFLLKAVRSEREHVVAVGSSAPA